MTPQKLPLWRLIAALCVLGSLVAVLAALTPVYLDNFRLQRSLRDFARHPSSDGALQMQVLERARQLDLPVTADKIEIGHAGGKVQIQMKYEVEMIFPLYRVDLHFHPSASEP